MTDNLQLPLTPDQLRAFTIFFPHAAARYQAVIEKRTRFVQYTRAENLLAMLRSRSVWLRKTSVMNDYSEISHGWEVSQQAFEHSDGGKRFRKSLDDAHPGIVKKIAENFDPWISNYQLNTYVASVSEHDASEDKLGRLSMWRAYGGRSGVAIVLKPDLFLASSTSLGAISSPVAYFDKSMVEQHFDIIASNISANSSFVKGLPPEQIIQTIHEALRFGMICCKHPGFAEEREWRVVYNPDRDIRAIDNRPIQRRVETIGGTPQPVYAVPLKKLDDGYDLEIASILDRIIVGPSEFPSAIIEALQIELENLGVPDARKKVVFSDIPLRL